MDKTAFADFRTVFFVCLIIIITTLTALIFRYFFDRYVKKLTKVNRLDYTSFTFVRKITFAIIYLVGGSLALAQIPEMKLVGHSMLAGAGIFSLIAGLASQQVLSNIMSGFMIVIFKPFRIGDRITVDNTYTGIVEELNLRQVIIRDFDNNRIVVPNSLISSQVILNTDMTETKVCKKVEVGIGYDSDIGKALSIMREEVAKHPLHIDPRTPEDIKNDVPEVASKVVSLGDSSVVLRVWAYAETASKGFTMNSDLLRSIKERFDAENIEIPYNYQNVIIKKTQ